MELVIRIMLLQIRQILLVLQILLILLVLNCIPIWARVIRAICLCLKVAGTQDKQSQQYNR